MIHWAFSKLTFLSLLLSLCMWTSIEPREAHAQSPREKAMAEAKAKAEAMRSKGKQPRGDNEGKDEEGSGDNGDEKNDGDKKEGEDDKNEGDANKPVMRTNDPPEPPDPKELDQKVGDDGRIQFSFRNQPWPDFLEWLAEAGGYSIDWQQIPGDYLNLVSQKRYTIDQARDLVNRLLMERGYTTVLQDKVMSVVKIDKIDPSLLTRIDDESELLDHPPHDFAKITFKLPEKLKADKAVEDIKPLLSPNAKVQALMATNRLLIIDAIINLREVSLLINQEHAAFESHVVPVEFHIKYAPADYIADQVMILLGLDPSSRRSPSELQVEQQRLQLFMQMQQKGKDVTKFLRPDSAPRVFIAVNKRVNSLLVNAPAADLIQIERAIEKLDVPQGAAGGSQVATTPAYGSSEMATRKYKLTSLKPESVISALKEIGGLDPRTNLYMDSDAKVIFASATERDHEQISELIDKLDGTDRTSHVIWLKRLPADQVAVTIKNLLVGEEEKKDKSQSYFSRRYGGGGDDDKKDDIKLRVEADVVNNRLLLFANDDELEEVKNLLMQLGELPGADQTNPNTIRVLDRRSEKATAELLEQLQKAWPLKNPLKIQGPIPKAEDEQEEADEEIEKVEPPVEKKDKTARNASRSQSPGESQIAFTVAFPGNPDQPNVVAPSTPSAVETEATDASAPVADDNSSTLGDPDAEPITLSVAEDGRIIITSKDTAALDMLEDLLARMAPPPTNHKVYYLKHALASLVKINLEEYFEGDENFDTQDNWVRAWHGLDFQSDNTNNGLASRRPVRFIYDIDTNSILVRDATPDQLQTIDELIEIYDRAPSEDSISSRRMSIFKMKYSQASAVAATLKEVFRDLLSSKDKEFAGQNNDKEKKSSNSGFFRFFGPPSDDSPDKASKVKASFEGAVSIGVDDISNTIFVTAQEEWMPSIESMVEYMDENAKPDTQVVVSSVAVPVKAEVIQALSNMLRPWPGNKKPVDAGGTSSAKEKAKKEGKAKPQPDRMEE